MLDAHVPYISEIRPLTIYGGFSADEIFATKLAMWLDNSRISNVGENRSLPTVSEKPHRDAWQQKVTHDLSESAGNWEPTVATQQQSLSPRFIEMKPNRWTDKFNEKIAN